METAANALIANKAMIGWHRYFFVVVIVSANYPEKYVTGYICCWF